MWSKQNIRIVYFANELLIYYQYNYDGCIQICDITNGSQKDVSVSYFNVKKNCCFCHVHKEDDVFISSTQIS